MFGLCEPACLPTEAAPPASTAITRRSVSRDQMKHSPCPGPGAGPTIALSSTTRFHPPLSQRRTRSPRFVSCTCLELVLEGRWPGQPTHPGDLLSCTSSRSHRRLMDRRIEFGRELSPPRAASKLQQIGPRQRQSLRLHRVIRRVAANTSDGIERCLQRSAIWYKRLGPAPLTRSHRRWISQSDSQAPHRTQQVDTLTRPGMSGERIAGVSRLSRPVRCERSRAAPPRGALGRRWSRGCGGC